MTDKIDHIVDSEDEPRQTSLKFMDWQQVTMIDEALNSLGDYGEVRLIIEKGRIRFLVTQKSFDALKWQPGSLKG